MVTLFQFSKQQGGWLSLLEKQVFEEKSRVHWLPCAPGNSAHTPCQPLAKVNPAPPLAIANLLTGKLRWGQSSQRVYLHSPWGCISVLSCPICTSAVLLHCADACYTNYCRPELLPIKVLICFGTGKLSLWDTVQSTASKASVLFQDGEAQSPLWTQMATFCSLERKVGEGKRDSGWQLWMAQLKVLLMKWVASVGVENKNFIFELAFFD